MLKDLFSKFWKFIATKEFVAIIVFLILAWAIINYTSEKSVYKDGFDSSANAATAAAAVHPSVYATAAVNTAPRTTATVTDPVISVTNPSDLLPKDQNSEWSALNPVNNGNPAIPDLLQAGYHIGLDTIGQTLRNPNYQLRSDPIIPKAVVGPWNMSTIEPDLGRVPLEVGCGGK